jgi:hypothetical protein
MSTVQDLITVAYRRLGLIPPGDTLDVDRALAGLELFNDMIASWQSEGSTIAAPAALAVGSFDTAFINDGIGTQTVPETGVAMDLAAPYALTDPFPMDPMFFRGVAAMLAVDLAPENGIEATATLQKQAEKAWHAILAYYIQAPDAQTDPALAWAPSLRRYGFR